MKYPKRLIEVDLPIARISAHARREKSIRHGHISTLHIWWARRPLAACRAVICAALWPDPADSLCPNSFVQTARREMLSWTPHERQRLLSEQSRPRFEAARKDSHKFDDLKELRSALLDFIADFANWDHSTVKEYVETSRSLTLAAHEGLGGAPGTRPLIVDPFAGGGAIPLEALRVGADAFASDLNPVAVLLNKVVLEYIPKYGRHLAEGVRKWGEWIKEEAERELSHFYPKRCLVPEGLRKLPLLLLNASPSRFGCVTVTDAQEYLDEDGCAYTHYIPITESQAHSPIAMQLAFGFGSTHLSPEQLLDRLGKIGAQPLVLSEETPIAYLWARTVTCEGPSCGAEVPLLRSLWLGKKANRSIAVDLVPNVNAKRTDFRIIIKQADGWVDQDNPTTKINNPGLNGTVKRGSVTCPCCGYTKPVARVREQLKTRLGGTNDARLFCVVSTRATGQGRAYRLPTQRDITAVRNAEAELERRKATQLQPLSLVPEEPTPQGGGAGAGRAFSQRYYGMDKFAHLFTCRQLLALTTLGRLVQKAGTTAGLEDKSIGTAIQTCLALAISRLADRTCSLCTWRPQADQEKVEHVFSRQALQMTWDFAEGSFLSDRTAGWNDAYEPPAKLIEAFSGIGLPEGSATQGTATAHPLPDNAADIFATDPPYYDAVPYSDLSDFFFVWLKRCLPSDDATLFATELTPKDEECIVDEVKGKDRSYFVATMKEAMAEGRRVIGSKGVGVVVFAHKSTAGWEAQLQAMVDAGWIVTGSWPIDTEMGTRLRARDSAALASSVHLICRPRENLVGGTHSGDIGDWRDVLQELPYRIHDWMPRLAAEGVVGADAIFACLGPALEIFSRYSRVEKASGAAVSLKEYLEQVWAAVAKEALSMVFEGADASGFEPDARLTAMWLWTLNAGKTDVANGTSDENEGEDDAEGSTRKPRVAGFFLEYDAARKIAQGLGAHLEDSASLVGVSGDQARLLPVAERARYLFGKDDGKTAAPQRKKREAQLDLFGVLEAADSTVPVFGETKLARVGETVLDRIHQCMILFAAGRGEALKHLLIEGEAGHDPRFWRLAQALSALYPKSSDEKRWVDGVLARKKGLGL